LTRIAYALGKSLSDLLEGETMARLQILAKHLPRVEDEWFERMNLASQGVYEGTTQEEVKPAEEEDGEFDPGFFKQMSSLRKTSDAIKRRKKSKQGGRG